MTHLVKNLQTYKTANGRYSGNLSKVIRGDERWIYYFVDSTDQSFMLAYSSRIMDRNTFRYSSQTSKWEEGFNY